MKAKHHLSILASSHRWNTALGNFLRGATIPRSALWIAPLLAIVCVVSDYCLSNLSLPLSENSSTLWLPAIITRENSPVPDDIVMYDVAYDKELVPVIDPEYGDTLGVRTITSRSRLQNLLNALKDAPYRYLFIDIRFESADQTDCDSALFAKLRQMPRMCLSTHVACRDYKIADTTLLKYAGYNDFRNFIFNDFSHYEVLQYGQPSVAERMYEAIDGKNVTHRWGPVYTSGNHLCYNNLFLPLTKIGINPQNDTIAPLDDFTTMMPSFILGREILDIMPVEEIHAQVSDKIVLVGDFVNDLHSTYVGDIPGALLAYAAYKELHAGNHLVNWPYILTIFVLYTLIGLGMLMRHPLYAVVLDRCRINLWQLRFLLSLIGYGAIIYLTMIACYLIWHISLNILVPTLVFGLLALCLSIKKSYE